MKREIKSLIKKYEGKIKWCDKIIAEYKDKGYTSNLHFAAKDGKKAFSLVIQDLQKVLDDNKTKKANYKEGNLFDSKDFLF